MHSIRFQQSFRRRSAGSPRSARAASGGLVWFSLIWLAVASRPRALCTATACGWLLATLPATASGQFSAEKLREGIAKAKADAASGSAASAPAEAPAPGGPDSLPPRILGIPMPDLAPLFAEVKPDGTAEAAPTLKDAAQWAFQAGDQKTARQLMFAHMAAEYEDAESLIRSVRYSPLLKRPVWDVRFCAGLIVRNGAGDDVDPSPIPATGGSPRRVATPRATGSPPAAGSGRTADSSMAERMAAALNRNRPTPPRQPKRVEPKQPPPGEVSSSGEEDSDLKSTTPDAANRSAGDESGPPADGLGQREMLNAQADEELREYLGLVAEIIGAEFVSRHQRGDFGSLLAEMESQDDTAATDGTADAPPPSSVVPLDDDALPMWKPGIVYLGQGSKQEILEQAQAAGLDMLIVFEVVLRTHRGTQTQNISRCRLIDVKSGDSIGLSRPIDNQHVAPDGETDEDYVRGQLQNLLEILDRDIKVIALPQLTPEIARNRVGRLLDGPPNAVRTLAEIRLYQLQNLLTINEVEQAFSIVGGEDALTLLYGSPTERRRLARRWVTQSAAADNPRP